MIRTPNTFHKMSHASQTSALPNELCQKPTDIPYLYVLVGHLEGPLEFELTDQMACFSDTSIGKELELFYSYLFI